MVREKIKIQISSTFSLQKIWFIVLLNFMSPPPPLEKYIDLLVRKTFLAQVGKDTLIILFMSFSLRESKIERVSVYPGKNERCISKQVYYTQHYKKLLFTNLSSYIRAIHKLRSHKFPSSPIRRQP